MTASQIFDLIAPDYSAHASKAGFLTLAAEETSACYFGTYYDRAVALRAAHLCVLNLNPARSDGTVGAITSKSEGELSLGFSAGETIKGWADLQMTHYGRQLISLSKKVGAPIGVLGGRDDGCNTGVGFGDLEDYEYA